MNVPTLTLPFFGTIHPKVTAAAVVTVLTAVVAFVTNTFGLTVTPVEAIVVTGVIAAIAGYLAGPPVVPAPAPAPAA